jgi:hypothetical protein
MYWSLRVEENHPGPTDQVLTASYTLQYIALQIYVEQWLHYLLSKLVVGTCDFLIITNLHAQAALMSLLGFTGGSF